MKLEQIEIPVTNQLLNDYWSHWEKLNSFFNTNITIIPLRVDTSI